MYTRPCATKLIKNTFFLLLLTRLHLCHVSYNTVTSATSGCLELWFCAILILNLKCVVILGIKLCSLNGGTFCRCYMCGFHHKVYNSYRNLSVHNLLLNMSRNLFETMLRIRVVGELEPQHPLVLIHGKVTFDECRQCSKNRHQKCSWLQLQYEMLQPKSPALTVLTQANSSFQMKYGNSRVAAQMLEDQRKWVWLFSFFSVECLKFVA